MNNFGIGGRGRGRGQWPQEHNLRRPHSAGVNNDESKTVNIAKSTLSPDAAEFVPSHLQNLAMAHTTPNVFQRPSVQNRLEIARRSVAEVPEPYAYQQQASSQQNFYPDNQMYYPYEDPYNNAQSNDYNRQSRTNNAQVPDLNVTINQLQSSMKKLTLCPGEFDHLVSTLVNDIIPFLDNSSHCQEIIAVIIKQSINEGNFRYSGARLCTHLDTVATSAEQTTSTFRDVLLRQCQEETQKQINLWQQKSIHTEDEEKKCHGLIMFLAELVTQMHTFAPTLGKMVIQLMSVVLTKPGIHSVKHVCQCLKLAGQTLERDNAASRKDMEQLMAQLSELVIDKRVDASVGRMVQSVSDLRNNSWGRMSLSITPSSYPSQPPPAEPNIPRTQHYLDEPVFYGPDGKIISSEESEFLQGLTKDARDEESGFNRSDGSYTEEDIEDNIIAEAYEEFLKMSENSSNQIKHQ